MPQLMDVRAPDAEWRWRARTSPPRGTRNQAFPGTVFEESCMKKWTKSAGLLFMAAASVYVGQAVVAAPGKPGAAAGGATPATEVKLLEETKPADGAAGEGTDRK